MDFMKNWIAKYSFCPFSEHKIKDYKLIKSAVFKNDAFICVLELQWKKDHSYSSSSNFAVILSFRYMNDGTHKIDNDALNFLCDDCTEAENVYGDLYTKLRYSVDVPLFDGFLSTKVGSTTFYDRHKEWHIVSHGLPQETIHLLEYIWQEAHRELDNHLSAPISTFSIPKIEEAESLLFLIHGAQTQNDSDKLKTISEQFYQIVPHHDKPTINTLRLLVEKQELCQLIKDIITVTETTGWDGKLNAVNVLYQALKCQILPLSNSGEDYQNLEKFILESQHIDVGIVVNNIYQIEKKLEKEHFKADIRNFQHLFHASSVSNIVGILSRGIMMPQNYVKDYGGKRTDVGMLGAGIYFSDSTSTSVKYSKCGSIKGTRMLVVNEVALGRIYETSKFCTSLTVAPPGYDSIHGVRNQGQSKSDFADDEYVVYKTNQQRLCYLVEFHVEGDIIKEKPPFNLMANSVNSMVDKNSNDVEIDDIWDAPDPLKNIEYGLLTKDDQLPLTKVDVEVNIIDTVAKIILRQTYFNPNDKPIEAKYVFPLDDSASVCGFEAFTKDKHYVGRIKVKEEALKEYREAIAEGHGAYLMEQEKPELFSVNVGNIPLQSEIIIKITYVCELEVIDDEIILKISNSVAPWDLSRSLNSQKQSEVESVSVQGSKFDFQIKGQIKMKSIIKSIETDSAIETRIQNHEAEFHSIGDGFTFPSTGFHLNVKVSDAHSPRLWIEENITSRTKAAMLTFYPKLQNRFLKNPRFIILIDCSNSMKLAPFENAQKIAKLCRMNLCGEGYFNIICFGSVFRELYPKLHLCKDSQPYSKEFIESLDSNLGDTDLYQVLEAIYALTPNKAPKNILLISDGHILNKKMVFEKILQNNSKCRIFSFAVGQTADKHTMRLISKYGLGSYQFFDSKFKSKWLKKVNNQIDNANKHSIDNLTIEFGNSKPGVNTLQAPAMIPQLFNQCHLLVYFYFDSSKVDLSQISIKGMLQGHAFKRSINIKECVKCAGTAIHSLAVRSILHDWEDGLLMEDTTDSLCHKNSMKNRIIDLSKQFSILCSLTSFIAVETEDYENYYLEENEEDGEQPMSISSFEDERPTWDYSKHGSTAEVSNNLFGNDNKNYFTCAEKQEAIISLSDACSKESVQRGNTCLAPAKKKKLSKLNRMAYEVSIPRARCASMAVESHEEYLEMNEDNISPAYSPTSRSLGDMGGRFMHLENEGTAAYEYFPPSYRRRESKLLLEEWLPVTLGQQSSHSHKVVLSSNECDKNEPQTTGPTRKPAGRKRYYGVQLGVAPPQQQPFGFSFNSTADSSNTPSAQNNFKPHSQVFSFGSNSDSLIEKQKYPAPLNLQQQTFGFHSKTVFAGRTFSTEEMLGHEYYQHQFLPEIASNEIIAIDNIFHKIVKDISAYGVTDNNLGQMYRDEGLPIKEINSLRINKIEIESVSIEWNNKRHIDTIMKILDGVFVPENYTSGIFIRINKELASSGLNSLGRRIKTEIETLLALMILLMDIFISSTSFVASMRKGSSNLVSEIKTMILSSFKDNNNTLIILKALIKIEYLQKKNLLIHHTLQLGNSYESFCFNMLKNSSI